MRQPQTRNAGRAQTAVSTSISAPVGGWDQKNALAAMPPDSAVIMDNWIPRPGYCEIRAGSAVQVSGFTAAVHSLLIWRGASSDHLFAAAANGIYDAGVQGASAGSPVYTASTQNAWSYVNFQNTAGQFLWACNGGDTPVYFDGATWRQNAGLSGTSPVTLNTSNLISCFVNASRIWAIEDNSLRAWFLPVAQITGTMSCLDLGSVFTLGGKLAAGASWTAEGGMGLSEYAIFITTKGEIAVYQGTDPSNANNWSLVGVFTTGEPIGKGRCLLRMGAEVMIITTLGVVPLSQILSLDRAAQENVSITDGIKNAFYTAQRDHGSNFGWEGITYPAGGLTLFNIPTQPNTTAVQYVQVDQNGKWCRFTGMNAICWGLANGKLYFGAPSGDGSTYGVYLADSGATDNGVPVTYDLQWAFSAYGLPGRQKTWTMARPLLRTSPRIQPALAMLSDYSASTPANIPTVPAQAATVWGAMVWGSTLWTDPEAIRYDWVGVGAVGFVGAPRMTFSISEPTGSLVSDGNSSTVADGSGDELAVSAATYAVPVQLLGLDIVFKPGNIL